MGSEMCIRDRHTNFTGHPSLTMPREFRQRNDADRPVPVLITGHLNDDARLLAFATAYQGMIDAHLKRPPMEDWLEKFNTDTLDKKPEPKEEKKEVPKSKQGQDKKADEKDADKKESKQEKKKDSKQGS